MKIFIIFVLLLIYIHTETYFKNETYPNILNEKLSLNILWGSIVTVTGVFLVNYSTKKASKIIVEAEI